ncbi:MAG: class I SAM-dependent rRNA methyltransferase [Prolixibacteraceae bacterium]|jgi:23S rRNA (cytosine1962-C5)-methyltransferase|nr:class I SAM-dependent rRNA methyltransferase [Prolixibacteraceae bacterium]MBT6005446.1 class I SAM-dependent rRNA methyltransferase [Prolixibacteraceae bacterium]MBT6764030.1 class I SAM-dependent rRNA methyltransferase [Prolixibacteraceae bacterium]MBT6999531.1 class I SAM-dependent rRNA methyltransferase [Prolixibacteraceae bacterium]MBT7395921.1 class I SAM-dependent rRNA methyltransferase [Prolixibacteraceae bacterium]
MTENYTKIVLKSGKDQSLKRFHPWVFSGAIKKIYGNLIEGDLVSVYSNKDEFLGLGHYQIGAIAVRIISFIEVVPDYDFWKKKIENAWNYRKLFGFADNEETNVFRLIHAEGDGMPGLIADFYNGTVVLQMHSIGMYLIREVIVNILKEVLGEKLKAVYNKSAKTLPFKAEIQSEDAYLFGGNNENEVLEHGLKFKVDWKLGQKTGFFIDQRENRLLVQKYSQNRDVLNMFCYTGGFSFYAMKGGANLVHSVDSSAKAIDLTNENVELNFPNNPRHQAFSADGFEYLKEIQDKYDLIILDPPAFAKHRNTLPQALKGYKRINTRAFEQIRPGGILFTFSCSQVVSKDRFREAVFSAAAISGRNVRILHQLSQPTDHPINIYHPESEYLKGLVLYVE